MAQPLPLAMLGLLFLLLIGTGPVHGSSCSDTSSVTRSGNTTWDVLLAPGDPISLTIPVDCHLLPAQPIDIYFLWETSLRANFYSHYFYKNNLDPNRYLKPRLDALRAANPAARFGIGFFQTKRLRGIGWDQMYAFEHGVGMTSNTNSIIHAMIPKPHSGQPWSSFYDASNITTGLESLMHVALNEDSFGFRPLGPHRRRIIIMVTYRKYGHRNDVWPLLGSPDPHFPIQSPPGHTIANFPPNNYDGVLDANCQICGRICADAKTFVRNPDGSFTCSPGGYSNGCIGPDTSVQFAPGSCEDFPERAPVAAIVKDSHTLLYTMVAFDPLLRSEPDPALLAIYHSLGAEVNYDNQAHAFDYFGNFSTLVAEFPPIWIPPIVTETAPSITSATFAQNDTACWLTIDFLRHPHGQGLWVVDASELGGFNFTINDAFCQSFSESSSTSPAAESTVPHRVHGKNKWPLWATIVVSTAPAGVFLAILLGLWMERRSRASRGYERVDQGNGRGRPRDDVAHAD